MKFINKTGGEEIIYKNVINRIEMNFLFKNVFRYFYEEENFSRVEYW